MKQFFAIFLTLVLSIPAFANPLFEGKSAEELSRYEITVTDKVTGKVIGKMTRDEYKVVSVESSGAAEVMMANNQNQAKVIRALQEERSSMTYSAILTGGVGKDGVVAKHPGSDYEVTERTVPVGQATLCATKNSLGLCATASTNEFYGLGLKLDWK